jgi:nucleoside-diphosphate-sugar epimerase
VSPDLDAHISLVTGAGGFIGSHLTEALLGEGHRVIGIDTMEPTYGRAIKERNLREASAHPAFSLHERDIARDPLDDLFDGVDTVFHLAARPGVRDSWEDFDAYVQANVVATKRVFDACVGRGIRVVYASSSSVYGDAPALPVTEGGTLQPVSPYGATKVTTEVIAGAYWKSHGLESVGMRYFTVYGPRQRPDMAISRFIEAGDRGTEIGVYGDGQQLRDFTYVGDVVRATLLAARNGTPGHLYNIASGDPHPLLDVLDQLSSVMERPLSLRFDPTQLGDVRDTWASIKRARQELGFRPQTTLREGLGAQVRETRERRDAAAGVA